MKERSFSIKTLGCKMNQNEAARMTALLSSRGWSEVSFGEAADLVIIHTCTVTDNSDRKCRNYIRQGARFSRSGKVVVTGCMGRRDPAGISSMKEVSSCFDHRKADDLYRSLTAGCLSDDRASGITLPASPGGKTRSYIEIQDGCDGKCSYCIVPSVRGAPVSRPYDEIIDEAKQRISEGVPELVFTGITIGRYQCAQNDLAALAEAVLSLPGDFRLRITSIEPRHVTARLISLFGNPKLCDHIHLPLQSGSNRILQKMNRPYTAEEYLSAAAALKKQNPHIALGADIIVGYPGETDEDFEQTLDCLRQAQCAFVHQFSYSPRSGTVSSSEKECSPRIVSARSDALRALAGQMNKEYASSFTGSVLPAVVEREKDGVCCALTSNYLKVRLPAGSSAYTGRIVPVRILSCAEGISGEIVSDFKQ
ncbi:MAG: MiaB/RimO family radical SAM methylthiotransferase [Spirochaetota bacterium]